MIIYGSKMYGVKNVVKGVGLCEHCGVYGKHKSYDGRKWGHLYFVPLIPSGGPVRVMKECAKCNMGNHLPQSKVSRLYRDIEAMMQPCILAASEGAHSFTDDQGTETYTGPFLLDAVDLMYTAGYRKEIPGLIAMLDSDISRYEHGIASGAYKEIQGDAAGALAAYQGAMHADPDQALPYMLLADFHGRAGRVEEQLDMLDKAIEREPDNPQLLLVKVDPLEKLKRYQDILTVMERAEQMIPGLDRDKQYKKQKKKFEKKAAKAI
ncbi:MAG: tetratricopeptide repeat protein [Planctomycetota bacterium]